MSTVSLPPNFPSLPERSWLASRGPLLLGLISILLGIWLSGLVQCPLEGILLLKRRILASIFVMTGVGAAFLWARLIRAEAARSAADRAVQQSNEELHRSADLLPIMMWTMDQHQNRDFLNRAWLDLVGGTLADHLGRGWVEAVHPDDREPSRARVAAAYQDRLPFKTQFRLRARDGTLRSVIAHGSPRFRPTGEFIGYIGVSLDVTPLQEANENLQRLLARENILRRELNHRVRNNLASLLGLATIYGRAQLSGPEVAAAFREKVFAITQVHDLVSASTTEEAGLHDLCRRLAEALGADPGRVTLRGPDVFLRPYQAGPMAMILQELFTNSRKHGALNSGGSVAISWTRRDAPPGEEPLTAIEFLWDETLESPPPRPLGRDQVSGTGIDLIRGLAAAELRGGAEFSFGPSSVRCSITIFKPAREPQEPPRS